MNLAQLLVRAARVHPDRPAVLRGERVLWRYRELADRVARLAGHLRALGLAAGDRASQAGAIFGIIDALRAIGPEVGHLMPLVAEPAGELVLEQIAGMVGGEGNAHGD